MSSPTPMIDGSRAESLKAKGNAALSSKRPLDAVVAFTDALSCSPEALRAVLLSNRSLAYLECGDVSNAETDALACLCIDESWFRAHARYAAARESRGDHLGAARSFSAAAVRAGKTVEADSMRSAAARCLGAFETAEKRKAAESMGSPRPTLAQLMNLGRRRVEIAESLKSAPSLWTLAAAHPAVRIARGNQGRGRGLFATRIIRAFEPVIVDTAVMYYPMWGDSAGPTIAGLASRPAFVRPGSGRASSEASQTWPADNIDGILLQLAPFSVDAGEQFSAPTGAVSASELYQAASALNALSAVIDEDAPAEYRRVLFVAPVGALVNHSCAPNCSYEGFWDKSRDAPGVRIFAEVDIAEGDEITISYVDRSLAKADRAARLKDYGFDCICARCAALGDDSQVFACAACPNGNGRLIYGSPSCESCGAPPPAEICTAAGALSLRNEWLSTARNDVATLASFGSAPAAGLPSISLHASDQARFSALYAQLGALWNRDSDNELRCAASSAVVNSQALARSGRGPTFASDALLIAGHYHTLAGQRVAASEFYRRAAVLFRAGFGDRDPRAFIADDLAAAKAPKTKSDIERTEQKRLLASSSWTRLYDLEPARVKRWAAPVEPDSTDSFALEVIHEADRDCHAHWLPWRLK